MNDETPLSSEVLDKLFEEIKQDQPLQIAVMYVKAGDNPTDPEQFISTGNCKDQERFALLGNELLAVAQQISANAVIELMDQVVTKLIEMGLIEDNSPTEH